MSWTGKQHLELLDEHERPHSLHFHRRHTSILGDRHSYHHHHHLVGANGFFQSVRNSKLALEPHPLPHH